MKSAGITWDAATLDRYLAIRRRCSWQFMPFSGVPDAAERAAVIDYLKTLK